MFCGVLGWMMVGRHCDIDQMSASQLAGLTLYFHSGLGQELLHNIYWGAMFALNCVRLCLGGVWFEAEGLTGIHEKCNNNKNLFSVHCSCWAETFDISDGFGELVNFLIGLMEFLCSITLFIPQTVMEVPGPGDNARIIHSHKVRKARTNPSHPSGLSKEWDE